MTRRWRISDEVRARIVQLHDLGYRRKWIARNVGVHRGTVRDVLVHAGRLVPTQRQARSLRPKHVTACYEAQPRKWAEQCNDAFVAAMCDAYSLNT